MSDTNKSMESQCRSQSPLRHNEPRPKSGRASPVPSNASAPSTNCNYSKRESQKKFGRFQLKLSCVPIHWKWRNVMGYIKKICQVDRDIANDIGFVGLKPNHAHCAKDAYISFKNDYRRNQAFEQLKRTYEKVEGHKLYVTKIGEGSAIIEKPRDSGQLAKFARSNRITDCYNDALVIEDTETYGLSVNYLRKLDIKLPLIRKIFVRSLPEQYKDEVKARSLFSQAGLVVSLVTLSKGKLTNARVEYDHPVEAVQAISMFHNREILGSKISCEMDGMNKNWTDGMPVQGPGLGLYGTPLRGARLTVEVTKARADFMKEFKILSDSLDDLKVNVLNLLNESSSTKEMSDNIDNMPVINASNPLLNASNPLINASNPLINASNPLLNASNPLINASNPLINASNPLINASNPLINASNPLINASNPLLNASNPLINASNPLINASNPLINASNPLVNASSPLINAPNPSLSVANPLASHPLTALGNIISNQLPMQLLQNLVQQNSRNDLGGLGNALQNLTGSNISNLLQKAQSNNQSGETNMQGGYNMQVASNMQGNLNMQGLPSNDMTAGSFYDIQRGPSNMQGGPSNDMIAGSFYNFQRGPSNMQSGPNYMQSGSSNMQSGPNNMQSGSSNMQSGPNNMQSGSSNMQSGPNNMQSGSSDMQTGPNNMQSGSNNIQSGSKNMLSGSKNMQSGSNNIQRGSNNMQTGHNNTQRGPNIQSGYLNTQSGPSNEIANIQSGSNMQHVNQNAFGSNSNTFAPPMQQGSSNIQGCHYNNMQLGSSTGPNLQKNTGFAGSPFNSNNTQNMTGNSSTVLLFTNLPGSVSLSALQAKMAEIGDVKFIQIPGPGRALINFSCDQDADKCVALFNHSKVDGQIIQVKKM